jgi:hypothetical protein
MRRWYAALGVAITCLLFMVGVSSTDARAAVSKWNAPMVLAAAETTAQPPAVAVPAPQSVAPAFGAYAVVGLETIIAAALLCYAVLQRRRTTAVPLRQYVVRLRGPPTLRDCIVLAP